MNDKRTLIALVLMALVIVVTPRFFVTQQRSPVPADSAAAHLPAAGQAATQSSGTTPAAPAAPAAVVQSPLAAPGARPATDSTTVATAHARYELVSPGASMSRADLPDFHDLRRNHHEAVRVAQRTGPLLHFRVANGRDTVALDTIPFAVTTTAGGATFAAPGLSLSYSPTGDPYVTEVHGQFQGAAPGAALLINLPSDFQSVEADTVDDVRHFAYGFKSPRHDVTSVPFTKLDTAVRTDTGAMQWVSARSKYWLVALLTPGTRAATAQRSGDGPAEFRNLTARRDTAVKRLVHHADAVTTLPLSNGAFTFDLYVGPQSWPELKALGGDLENVNQYSSFLRPVVQPFVTIVMRVLLWLKATVPVSYGWVLVLFGILIRLVLWPLNQRAMRSSIQMQRIQPELTELQKRYRNEPERQRELMMKLYQDHGMSPLSPLLGCLPMLLPLPVLYALYFVFQNTIEFRGVPFLWLPDISLRDPYYIIPIVMGASMFLLSWIGMRGVPPNPQTRVMSYMMPLVFTAMFANFASGLNLYYAVQNITSLPQQWLLSRERARANAMPIVKSPPPKRGG